MTGMATLGDDFASFDQIPFLNQHLAQMSVDDEESPFGQDNLVVDPHPVASLLRIEFVFPSGPHDLSVGYRSDGGINRAPKVNSIVRPRNSRPVHRERSVGGHPTRNGEFLMHRSK